MTIYSPLDGKIHLRQGGLHSHTHLANLYSPPLDFWDVEIFKGIGNALGYFIKMSKLTKEGRYTSYTHICVYMNVSKDLLKSIYLSYQDTYCI